MIPATIQNPEARRRIRLSESGYADQRPGPEPDLRRLGRTRGAAQHDRPGAADRLARLHALLGRRAPWRRDAGRAVARGADRPDRFGDRADPRGLGWRDAAALQPAEGGRDVLAACGPVPRPD